MGQAPKFHYYEAHSSHRAWSDANQDGLMHHEQIFFEWSLGGKGDLVVGPGGDIVVGT